MFLKGGEFMKPKVVVSLRVRESDYNKLKEIADKKDRRPTELMRLILENFVKNQEF